LPVSQFNCNVPFSANFEAILEPLSILNIVIISSLGLTCRVNNSDYVDTLVMVTLGPLLFVGFLAFLFALEVALRKYETKKLDSDLRRSVQYAIPVR